MWKGVLILNDSINPKPSLFLPSQSCNKIDIPVSWIAFTHYIHTFPVMHQLSAIELKKLSKAERRKRRRATPKYRNLHASRERIRVESFNSAFAKLRALLPTLPLNKKLSKIEILRLSIAYISYLNNLLHF
ncbi:unnamed protein product [Onchocerca ochengi]|uniref:BHLH domain-containing protein n=1 Tax=Onchocerca ochengi TaxID=42157 RepID=A0A182E350_ONCOC|nr:unnamed protein product [Onchocerca ochengi]